MEKKVGMIFRNGMCTSIFRSNVAISITFNYSGLAGVLSIMRLAQWVEGEGVGWCTAHSEVSTSSNATRTTRPYPLHSGCPSESSCGSNSAGEGVGLASCWVCSCCDGDLE